MSKRTCSLLPTMRTTVGVSGCQPIVEGVVGQSMGGKDKCVRPAEFPAESAQIKTPTHGPGTISSNQIQV